MISQKTYAETLATLRRGGVCVYPTGTFYAVGCLFDAPKALARVASLKGRPETKPFSLLVGDMAQLRQVAVPWDAMVDRLAEHFWPGPLTVVLRALPGLDPMLLGPPLTGGGGDPMPSVAVRCTAHPLAAQLALDAGRPLVATSANISGDAAASVPEAVSISIVTGSDGILAQPPWPLGAVPSTIVAPVESASLRVIRHGAVSDNALVQAGFILS